MKERTRESIPLSPIRNKKEITPTSGGNARGMRTIFENNDFAGNSMYWKTYAMNVPTIPLPMTLRTVELTERAQGLSAYELPSYAQHLAGLPRRSTLAATQMRAHLPTNSHSPLAIRTDEIKLP